MPSVDINWWAVLVAAVVNMVVGGLWYSPSVFGKSWAKLLGKKVGDMGDPRTGYTVAIIGALVESWVLAHFVAYAGSTTVVNGIVTGFWLWLAFVGVTLAIGTVFAGQSWKLWKINAGYFLVVLVIQSVILATWH